MNVHAESRKRILVVEDEPLIAMDLERVVANSDCDVMGPACTVGEAMQTLDDNGIDGAIIDVHVSGEMVYPLADALDRRHVPYIILSGHDRRVLPDRYNSHPFMAKPYDEKKLQRLIQKTFAT
jgi:two-component SAPR family response regulator